MKKVLISLVPALLITSVTAFAMPVMQINFPAPTGHNASYNVNFSINNNDLMGVTKITRNNHVISFSPDEMRVLNKLLGINFSKINHFTFYNCGSSYCTGSADAYTKNVFVTRSNKKINNEYSYTATPSTFNVTWDNN